MLPVITSLILRRSPGPCPEEDLEARSG
jgi:hypothetical protein